MIIDASFSNNDIDQEPPRVPEEYDDFKRYVEIFLYQEEINPFLQGQHFKHWALVFEFNDGSSRTIEGVNYNGTLLPSYTKHGLQNMKKDSLLGSKYNVSPKKIRDIAIMNPENGKKYSLQEANCHTWANAALKELDLKEQEVTIASQIELICAFILFVLIILQIVM